MNPIFLYIRSICFNIFEGTIIFITGHLEYDKDTLREEYIRDKEKGLNVPVPKNYFKDNDLNSIINHTWRGSASIIFSNWLNYCVYQNTPYDLQKL